MTTKPSWRSDLERDGFVRIPQALPRADVEALGDLALRSVVDYADSDDLIRTQSGVPLKLLYPLAKYRDFVTVLGHVEVREIVDTLVAREDSVLTWEDVLIKMPCVGSEVGVHQDVALTHGMGPAYSLGISLHRDHDNPVYFLPGSHRLGPLTATTAAAIHSEAISRFKPVQTDPGDIVVHNVHVLHYSEPNTSRSPRATWYLEFRSMRSLLDAGPWDADWCYRRRAVWVYARAAAGEDIGTREATGVKQHLQRLRDDRSAFRVAHVNEKVRYDPTSPYNHFITWTNDWKASRPATDGTHHVRVDNGRRLYSARFDSVLSFHEPGLAAARTGGESFHILPDGEIAYAERFDRTFGFYEGLAAVSAGGHWFHIRPNGTRAYDRTYAWCGNFQGGRCAVRESGGAYSHIAADGKPAYGSRWRYAGDFRDAYAVVQSADGRSTHVDGDGNMSHGRWFVDLDVYHKGHARARDESGWMHVDTGGKPIYPRRFASVEPFYNGQARVERLDGALEVIDEAGCTVRELRPPTKSEFASLSDDLTGFWRTQTICVAVELGVFEAFPDSCEAIAGACGLDPTGARRLLRALSELKLAEEADERWNATERGKFLRADHPRSLADAAVEYGRAFPGMWDALPRALRGEGWEPPDVFSEVAADPNRIVPHHRMLLSYARHDYEQVPDALGLRGDERVIDAGGGLGVLADLIVEGYPDVRVTVLDRPEVVQQATRCQHGDRVEFRPVDIFGPWPVEGDAVVMARVLHDWNDARARDVLVQARRALLPGARLYIVEMVVPEGSSLGALCDLHLLMATGGRERTVVEYAELLRATGFDYVGLRRLRTLPSIILGVAA